MKFTEKMHSRKKLTACIAGALAVMFSAGIQAEMKEVKVKIESKTAGQAILDLAEQTNSHIAFPDGLDKKLVLPNIEGEYTVVEALKLMLDGTGLEFQVLSDSSIIVKEGEGKTEVEREEGVDEEIVVTGSALITDPNKLTRQTTTFTREEIERSGLTRLDEFLSRLPQNVNAPSNIGSGNFRDGQNFGLGRNVFAGSGVNLRGLGSQYTLILIDGRRPARGGQFGDVVDISNIPLDRVARIEVLYDGAAAIYGADAVGGVINIITNRDYDGTNVNVTYEETQEGGGSRANISIANTLKWETGRLTSSFSYQGQKDIDGAERSIRFINSLPVPLGNPGNVGFALDQALFVPTPLFYVKDLDGDGATTTQTGIDPDFEAALGFFAGPAQQGERIVAGGFANIFDPSSGTSLTYNGFDFLNAGPFGAFVPDIPNPEDFGYTPVYTVGLPAGLTGTPGLYDFEEGFGLSPSVPLQGGISLAPKDDTYSVSFALDQELSESLTFTGTVTYSESEKVSETSNGVTLVNLGSPDSLSTFPDAPNPFGTTAAYPVVTGLPQSQQFVDQYSAGFSGELAWELEGNWQLNAGASYSISDNESIAQNIVNTRIFQNVAGGGERNAFVDTDGDGVRDTFISIPTDPSLSIFVPNLGFSSQQEYFNAVLNPDTRTTSRNKSLDTDIRLQGPLAELPAGQAFGAFTLGYRSEDSHVTNNTAGLSSTSIALGVSQETGRQAFDVDDRFDSNTASLGAEFTLPLVSESMELPLINNFLVNIQARVEDYSNSSQNGYNWSAGFNWEVLDSFTVRMNRNFSLRVPAGVRFAKEQEVVRSGITAYDDTRQTFISFLPAQSLIGAVPGLEPEKNYGTSLAFIFRPQFVEGLDLRLNLFQSRTIDQIGQPGSTLRFTLAELTDPSFVAANPLLFEPVNVDPSDTFAPVVGFDNRERNTGNTFNRGADLEINYFRETDIGSWFATLRHNYVDENIVDETGFCGNGECFSETGNSAPQQSGEPIDTVELIDTRLGLIGIQNPLPEHRSSLILGWSYQGLDVSLDTTYTSDTSIISENTLIVPNEVEPTQPIILSTVTERTTTPARGVNMRIGYDFSGGMFETPEWLRSTRVSLTVTNLYQKEQAITDRIVSSSFEGLVDFEQQSNLANLNPRGRTFSLNVSTTF